MTPAALAPGDWLGLLGGGQLGRMFCMAAQSLGFRVCVLDPDADGPAAAVADDCIVGGYEDADALDRLAARCRAVTTEFENVPAASLARLADRCDVRPAARSVAVAQDRLDEKAFLAGCGVAVAPHRPIVVEADLDACADATLYPAILKTARLGYDGKGQVDVPAPQALAGAWASLGRVACVLEKRLPLAREVSVVVCRGADGETAVFPVAENSHRAGILAVTIAPARIAPEVAAQARAAADAIVRRLDYVGVLCVEFFVLVDGTLVANEMAPRPHNSGHYTIDACVASQFEQQARILAGLPLGETRQLEPAVMLNLLGDIWFDAAGAARRPPFEAVLAVPGAGLHLYGKAQARRGRKMGHVTCVAPAADEALRRAGQVAAILGIAAPAG